MRLQNIVPTAYAAFAVLAVGLTASQIHAQATNPGTSQPTMVIYDDELKNDWQNWSWGATVELSVPAGGAKPIKVSGTPWSALDLHHVAMSTKGYTKLTFFINGGVDGGQQLAIKVKAPGGAAVDSNFVIAPKLKTWGRVEVPLKDIGAQDKTIEDIFFQGQATDYKPYYITKIQLE